MKALVGYTGFVGSNLFATGSFDRAYNSKDIMEAYGMRPDLLVYAGVRAEKYLANEAPEADMASVRQAEENIERIQPQKLVLISTVDIFKHPKGVDERSLVELEGLSAYGYDRYLLECWVRERYPSALIVRLPGLFGRNIKKNFIYDLINHIPAMLTAGKMAELSEEDPYLKGYYRLQDNGSYRVIDLDEREREELKGRFDRLGFNASHFTDSRSRYQFYPLERLWRDIQILSREDIRLWHPATEPVSAGELYHHLTGGVFENRLPGTPADYDYRTIHADLFGGRDGYICGKGEIKELIKGFVRGMGWR